MSDQLLSADPNWGHAAPPPQPHPEARIGADPLGAHGGLSLDDPNAPITFGDLVENPSQSMQRIGAQLKRDLSDPKTWVQAAAMYFGPKMIPRIAPVVAKAAASVTAPKPEAAPGLIRSMVSAAEPKDIGIVSPRAGQAIDYVNRVRAAMRPPAAEPAAASATSPVETVSGGTAPPAGPPPEQVPAAPRAKSPQQVLNEEAIARRRAEYQAKQAAPQPEPAPSAPAPKPTMTAQEVKLYQELRIAGKTDAQARQAIEAMRTMNAQYGLTTPTKAETKFPKGMRGKVAPRDEP